MVPNEFITIIYKLWLHDNIKVYIIGDPNQCSSVDNGSRIYYNYLDSISVRRMCPKIETLEYS